MTRIIPLCFYLIFFNTALISAQNKAHHLANDSTYLSIQKTKNDTLRDNKLINYAFTLITRKSSLGTELSDQLIKKTNPQNYHTLGKIYLSIGFAYLQTGEYALSYPNYLKALGIYKKINEPANLIRVYQDMTWIQIQLTQFDNAESSVQNALKICKQYNLTGKEAEVYNIYGVLFDAQLKYDKAIECYKQSLLLNEKKGTIYNKISSLLNLGISQRRSKRYKEALTSLLKADDLVESGKVDYYRQAASQNLAELTYEMGDYDKAEKYILLALSKSNENGESVLQRGLYSNLQHIYSQKGDYKNALRYADTLAAMDKRVFDKDKASDVRNLQVKYETTLKDEKIARQNAINTQQLQQLEINRKQLELTLEQKKVEQLKFTQQQSALQKSKLEATLDQEISDKQILKQKETLETDDLLQRFLIFTIVLVIIISSLIFYNQFKTRQLNKVITQQKNDLEKINAVKDHMFNIVGHDMRSPVNTLMAFNHLLEDDNLTTGKVKIYAKEIKKTLDQTSVLMDNLLNWSNTQMQGFKTEIAHHDLKAISDQVIDSVIAQATQKGITLSNNISNDVVIYADANMTELVMRNLITNAIKFTPNNGLIEINAAQTSTTTTFSITDNGRGMEKEQVAQFNSDTTNYKVITKPGTNNEKGTGLGLLLCKTFIVLMNGEIKVKSTPGEGSIFLINLPNLA